MDLNSQSKLINTAPSDGRTPLFAAEPHVRNWFRFSGYSAAVEQRMNILTACHMTVS
jgi:hypothetical protein